MTIRDELLALTDPQTEMIYADSVVAWAERNPDSELHDKFEWDDQKAAHAHRLDQARHLISLHVVYSGTGRRASVSLITDRPAGGGYREVTPVLNNARMRAVLLRQILDEVARVIDRYPQLNELDPLLAILQRTRAILEAAEQPLAAD